MKKYILCKGVKWIAWGLLFVLFAAVLGGCGGASDSTSPYTESENTSPYMDESVGSSAAAASGSLYEPVAGSDKAQNPRDQQSAVNQTAKGYKDVYYQDYGVNPFTDALENPLSTFSMDVDTASYTKARDYIKNGTLPPKDSIRVEEFVNYFKRQYPQPSRDTFSIYTEMAPSAFNRGYHILEVGIQGRSVNSANLKNTSLTFVIDISGSMNKDNRLKLVKRSLDILVDQMNENDKIGIVVYGTNGRKYLDPVNAGNKTKIMNAVNRLKAEGSTNAAEGLMIGYDMASSSFIEGGNNRVILCTDGVANEGITDAEQILRTIEDYKAQGIALTSLGFGMDNYNDIFLETLADKGDGNYAYIDTVEEAQKVLADQLTGTLEVIARDAKVQMEFNQECVESYRLIGYENRKLSEEDFDNTNVDAGEVGAGHAVTALYEVKLKSGTDGPIGTVRIRYNEPAANQFLEQSKQIQRSDVWNNFYNATPRFRFITMVAQTAEILKGSPWAGNTSLRDVYDILLRGMDGLDKSKEDSEFIDLVKKASSLKK